MAKQKKKNRGSTPEGKAIRMANLKKGKKFVKGDPRINRKGAPPKLLHHITAELIERGFAPVKPSQINEAFEILMNLPEQVIKEFVANVDAPMSIRIVGRCLLSAEGKEMLKEIREAAHGYAKQIINSTIQVHEHKLPDMTSWTYEQTTKFLETGELPSIHKPTADKASKG